MIRARVTWKEETALKMRYPTAIAFLAGIALTAAVTQVLHAETKPPAYVVTEADVMDDALYRAYVPRAVKALVDAGGTYVVRDGNSVSLFGVPPNRVAIIRFDSLEKAEEAFNSPAFKEAKKAGDEAADFRVYAIEGVAP